MRLDKERLLEAGMGDPEFIRELATMMLDDGEQRLVRLHAALQAEDWEVAGREAHSLKGAALNVGAEELAKLCAVVDDALRHLHRTITISEVQSIDDEFVAVKSEIQNVVANLSL
jgi:HPt (histidine-containing phosphotransfer) domain-containing protein